MVNVVITGGAGFLGSRLARELLAAGSLEVAGGEARPLSRVTLIDQAPVPPDLAADERVTAVRGDLAELLDPAAGGRTAGTVWARSRGDLPPGRGGQRGVRGGLRPGHPGEPARHRGAAGVLPRAGDQPGRGVLQLARRLRRLRRAPAPGGRRRPDPAQPADQLRRAEGHRRAAAGRLHQEGVPARAGTAPGRASACAPGGRTPRRPASCRASSGSRWPASARPARSARTPRSRWPRRPRPWPGCGAPPRPATRPGAAAARSTCPRSPSRRGHGGRAGPDRRTAGQRADRLDPRPGDSPDGRQLARPCPR